MSNSVVLQITSRGSSLTLNTYSFREDPFGYETGSIEIGGINKGAVGFNATKVAVSTTSNIQVLDSKLNHIQTLALDPIGFEPDSLSITDSGTYGFIQVRSTPSTIISYSSGRVESVLPPRKMLTGFAKMECQGVQ